MAEMRIVRSPGGGLRRVWARESGWTCAKRARFLDALIETGNQAESLRRVGMSRRGMRDMKERDAEFQALFEAALEEAYRRLEAELVQRALGTRVSGLNPAGLGKRRVKIGEFDARLALDLLKRRDALAKRMGDPGRNANYARATPEETNRLLVEKMGKVAAHLRKGVGLPPWTERGAAARDGAEDTMNHCVPGGGSGERNVPSVLMACGGLSG